MIETHPLLGRYVIPDMPSADELLPYLRQIDKNRWYSNFGPLVSVFEQRLEAHLSSVDRINEAGPLALTTVMTCYHALQIGLQLFRLPKEARVLIPALTFPACPLAVKHAGAEPVLADIDDATWSLTPSLARLASKKMAIHAVMPVAVYGVPLPTEEWDQFSEETGIPVIIDAAAALEAQPVLKKGLVAYSMHATKPFSIGEGGVLAGRSRALIDEARCISNFGTQNRISLQDGTNAKMSEYHGAVALAQLDRWATIKKRRFETFARYRKIIEKTGLDLSFQKNIERAIPSTLMLKSTTWQATKIVNTLNSRGIMAHRMYLPPLYHHPHFANLATINQKGEILAGASSLEQKIQHMLGSEEMHKGAFGLPFHTFLDEKSMTYLMDVLTEVMHEPVSKLASKH